MMTLEVQPLIEKITRDYANEQIGMRRAMTGHKPRQQPI
jgi:hypothetical protein